MKKLILFAGLYCLQPNLFAANENTKPSSITKSDIEPSLANARAAADLRQKYPNAEHVLWSANAEKEPYCSFHEQDKVVRVFYDRHGRWNYTMISYPGSGLESRIKDRVLEIFDGYKISYVNEIQGESNEPVYVLDIENENNIKVIRVSKNDDIEVKQDLQKR